MKFQVLKVLTVKFQVSKVLVAEKKLFIPEVQLPMTGFKIS